jgi:hypothetical protein
MQSRHVLIAPFFEPAVAEAMLTEFPVPRESETINEFGRKNRKFACHDVRSIGPTYRLKDNYISSPEFAKVIERVTGIQDLLYDPEYQGAGIGEQKRSHPSTGRYTFSQALPNISTPGILLLFV